MDSENIVLTLDDQTGIEPGDRLRDDLSAVVQVGNSLWLGSDEGAYLDRVSSEDGQYFEHHKRFALDDILELLAEEKGEEVDIEGLDYSDDYLWLVGSHSLKRERPKEDKSNKKKSSKKNVKRLRTVEAEANRYMLARIPLVREGVSGECEIRRDVPDPSRPDGAMRAAQLPGDEEGNVLLDALSKDKHFGAFTKIPSKDNGLDIEGLAVDGNTVFVGLRGPVLRGWAAVLRLEVDGEKDGRLRLKPIGDDGQLYTKHFLHLDGNGVRDLVIDGDDVLILAGPSMDLLGPVVTYRWKDGLRNDKEDLVWPGERERVERLTQKKSRGKAEGMARFRRGDDPTRLLVVYDSPEKGRKVGRLGARADLFDLA